MTLVVLVAPYFLKSLLFSIHLRFYSRDSLLESIENHIVIIIQRLRCLSSDQNDIILEDNLIILPVIFFYFSFADFNVID